MKPVDLPDPMIRVVRAGYKTILLYTRFRFAPDDTLWVREAFRPTPSGFDYRADQAGPVVGEWVASCHMPRKASRLTLQLTAARIVRLRDLTDEDIRAFGLAPTVGLTLRQTFMETWDAQHTRHFCWYMNPALAVYTFHVVDGLVPGAPEVNRG